MWYEVVNCIIDEPQYVFSCARKKKINRFPQCLYLNYAKIRSPDPIITLIYDLLLPIRLNNINEKKKPKNKSV